MSITRRLFLRNSATASRRAVEDEIERLIGLLDGIDGDPDMEPWLGDGDDRELDGSDDEPSHGWSDDIDQTRLVPTGSSQSDECEPDIGWTEEIDQERRLQTMPPAANDAWVEGRRRRTRPWVHRPWHRLDRRNRL